MKAEMIQQPLIQITSDVTEAYNLWNSLRIVLRDFIATLHPEQYQTLAEFEGVLRNGIDNTDSFDKLPELR